MTSARTTSLVFAALFLVYVAAGVWTTRRVSATGDEPYYFMAADAMLRGEGLDLTRRWKELGSASYGPTTPIPLAEFERSTAPSRVREGSYPLHDLGTSFLVAVPLAAGGRALAVVLVAVAMALAVALGGRAARALGARPAHAVAAAVAVGLSAPALTYSGQVFPDALAPLPFAAAVCALVGALPRWAFGPSLAVLPLLHVRFWPLALALLAIDVLARRPPRRQIVVTFVPLAAVVLGLSTIDLVTYGVPFPHAGFILFFFDRPQGELGAFTRATGEGLIGLFADRSFGLLSAAPITALAFVGIGGALRLRTSAAVNAALLTAALPYLIVISFLDWTGGFNPQARYLTVLVPLLVTLVAFALEWRPAALAAIPLAMWTTGQSLVYAVAPWLRYDSYGVAPLADFAWSRALGVSPSAVFPLLGTGGATLGLALAWSAVLLALVALGAAFAGPSGQLSSGRHT